MNNIKRNSDVIIVGAGITGLSAAIFLQRAGAKVTLIDAVRPGETGQASYGNAGLIAASAVTPLASKTPIAEMKRALFSAKEPVFIRKGHLPKMARFGIEYIQAGRTKFDASTTAMTALIKTSVDDHLSLGVEKAAALLRIGAVGYVYRDLDSFEHAKPKFERRAAEGFPLRFLENGLDEIDPAISPEFRWAASFADHAWCVNPAAYMGALLEEILEKGGQFVEENVVSIKGREVQTTTQRLQGEKIVLSAGAASVKLAASLGAKLPMEAERGYHLFLENANIAPLHPYLYYDAAIAITPMQGGLRAAGLAEFAGYDHAPRKKPLEYLRARVNELYPQLEYSNVREWMGRRPTLPDSLPVIDTAPQNENVVFAFGGQHLGLTMGPRLGMIARDLALGHKPNEDLQPFASTRFNRV